MAQCITGQYDDDIKIIPGTQCLNDGTHEYIAGCVHEHIDQGPVCTFHAESFLHRQIQCRTCFRLGHHCNMNVEMTEYGQLVR